MLVDWLLVCENEWKCVCVVVLPTEDTDVFLIVCDSTAHRNKMIIHQAAGSGLFLLSISKM